ncbi:MAG TPA: hypothetical protein VMW84_03895 [Acidobacteriota bacterium]|nr:hypothetical protein [Acidobacteriota bacterium]
MDIKLVKKLRDNSGASMSLVKTCLEDASWDYDAASILLQKKLGVGSVKREQNQTHFGVVALHVSFDRRTGTLLAVNCETDFVARNSQFVEFAQRGASGDLKEGDLETIAGLFKEKIALGSGLVFSGNVATYCGGYIHADNSQGAMVMLHTPGRKAEHVEALDELARDIGMQVVAMKPVCLDADSMEDAEQAKSIISSELQDSKKPPAIVEKIAEGRFRKLCEERCLLDQPFIKPVMVNGKETTISTREYIDSFSKEVGFPVKIEAFERKTA